MDDKGLVRSGLHVAIATETEPTVLSMCAKAQLHRPTHTPSLPPCRWLGHDLPQAGCRALANSFNLAHASSGHSISKTWAYELLKARAAALTLVRMESRRRSCFTGSGEPIQRVWGIDLTGLPLKCGETVDVWGIIDHGSRTVLQLEPIAKFNSLILLGKLLVTFGEYGIPIAIRSDNASVFKTPLFRATLKLLGVPQQFTALHCPWQNGRIERFWRTCKETLGTNPVRVREKRDKRTSKRTTKNPKAARAPPSG